MERSRLNAVGGFFLAAPLSSPAWGSIPPQPGTNGRLHRTISGDQRAVPHRKLRGIRQVNGGTNSSDGGRLEILLTPGIFLRIGDHSSLVSTGLADAVAALQKGRAIIEVADIRPENKAQIDENGLSTQLLKAGLYDFDADRGLIRVFGGEAVVQTRATTSQHGRGTRISVETLPREAHR